MLNLKDPEKVKIFTEYLDWLLGLSNKDLEYFYPKIPMIVYDKIEEQKEVSLKKNYSRGFINILKKCKKISRKYHSKFN